MTRIPNQMHGRKLPTKRFRDVSMGDLHDDVEHEEGRWPFYIAGALAALLLTFWLAVQMASLLAFHWIPVGPGVVGAAQGLAHLPKHLFDPAAGWPVALRRLVAPFWLLYPILAGLVFVEVKYGKRLLAWWEERNREDRGGTQWASERELSVITNVKKRPELKRGLVLGVAANGRPVRLEPENHALVVAGTRSGKTAGLCIPALLTFEGVVIATSVKNDLVDRTIEHRRRMGKVFLFDPTEGTERPVEELASWSPLEESRDWPGAQKTAATLIGAGGLGKKGADSSGTAEFFKSMALDALPVLLYAAAVMEEDMRRVSRWLHRITDQQTHAEIDAILRWKNNVPALDAWVGFVSREPKLRGDIAATIQSALIAYDDEKVKKHSLSCDITSKAVFDGGANTVYVCAPTDEQDRLQPVFITLIQGLLRSVTKGRPLETPLLVVLDEAANIAALPELPSILSTIGGYNASIVTAWQDFSQVKSRYGDQMNTILNNSRARLVLPGVADPETLDYFAKVTGETVEHQVSVSGAKRNHSVSVGEGRRTLLTPATIRQQQVGEAILVYGHLPPAKLKLRLYYKSRELRMLAGLSALPKAPGLALVAALIGRARAAFEPRVTSQHPRRALPAQRERRALAQAPAPEENIAPPSFSRSRTS